ncbi:hypothetical protein F5883DRAFT_723261 [Diaporthe sp. PMI_573]|nr:hypothetical protein F5883DRAFT_723261 [Diaporthaceae sp. PMI_573]
MVKLIDLGVDVNKSDDQGNMPLHLLIQLLYPSNEGSNSSRGLPGVELSQAPRCATGSPVDLTPSEDTDRESIIQAIQEQDMYMNGNNSYYDNDSDFVDSGFADEYDTGSDDYTEDESDSFSDGDDHSVHVDSLHGLLVLAKNGSQKNFSQYEPSGLARLGCDRELDRCDAWVLSFSILLCEGGSLTMNNNAGMTALDYIHGLRAYRANACPKAYRRIIPALRDFNLSDPPSSGLINELSGSASRA